jgi:hypothetical protein
MQTPMMPLALLNLLLERRLDPEMGFFALVISRTFLWGI